MTELQALILDALQKGPTVANIIQSRIGDRWDWGVKDNSRNAGRRLGFVLGALRKAGYIKRTYEREGRHGMWPMWEITRAGVRALTERRGAMWANAWRVGQRVRAKCQVSGEWVHWPGEEGVVTYVDDEMVGVDFQIPECAEDDDREADEVTCFKPDEELEEVRVHE